MARYTRRSFLRMSMQSGVYLQAGWLLGCAGANSNGVSGTPMRSNLDHIGPLGEVDAFGLRLPAGFRVRKLAQRGEPVMPGKDYVWHEKPDGGAVIPMRDGGWVYVSNSEKSDVHDAAGVGALRFDARGELVDAYPVLIGSTKNCAGGTTPWGTWLSCEETPSGYVYECFPAGDRPAVRLPALGKFTHEACAVDPLSDPMHIYMTEDERNDALINGGGFYRFVPDRNAADGSRPDLSSGRLQIAVVAFGDIWEPRAVTWRDVPQPEPEDIERHERVRRATRFQVPGAARFDGGEGIWYHPAEHCIVFSTKGDNRLWRYDIAAATVQAIYDDDRGEDNLLSAVDNVIMTPDGDIIVCEDGDDGQVVGLTVGGRQVPLLQMVQGGEPAGPSFSPDGQRLYISGYGAGATYEISGPWFVPLR